ncbi:MAG TPA: hypothetical protein VJT16_11620 [Streptosporangiaceae bacterium]|jgi:hypothetical protein|nr:hypothetical protein [Streptosporangiaceae bacterium]
MSFSQHLVLWLHVAFVIFTIGPVTLAIMSTPRHIRKRDIRILRYLSTMTLAFGIGSLGVLVVGVVLSSMIGKAGKPWIIISETLFVVSILLLGLIQRDQRRAIKALETATSAAAHAATAANPAADPPGEPAAQADQAQGAQAEPAQAQHAHATGLDQTAVADATAEADQPPSARPASTGQAADAAAIPAHLATVERGRIAMMGGVVTVIWLVVLVLMVWNG